MTREELRAHCERTIEKCKLWTHWKGEELNNNKIYQEHKLILELLEQESCGAVVNKQTIKEEMLKYGFRSPDMTVTEFIEDLRPSNSQKPCEDCISRQAAIYIASGYCHPANISAELAKLPPVQPKIRTGHWIMPRNDDGMSDPIEYQVRCSECGFDFDPQTWHMELHKYGGDKYCPYCGVRMIEPKKVGNDE